VVKCGGRVRLTTSPPSVSRLSRENVGASMSHNLMGLHGLLQRYLYLYLLRPRMLTNTRSDVHDRYVNERGPVDWLGQMNEIEPQETLPGSDRILADQWLPTEIHGLTCERDQPRSMWTEDPRSKDSSAICLLTNKFIRTHSFLNGTCIFWSSHGSDYDSGEPEAPIFMREENLQKRP
jgi:hypothetical protein